MRGAEFGDDVERQLLLSREPVELVENEVINVALGLDEFQRFPQRWIHSFAGTLGGSGDFLDDRRAEFLRLSLGTLTLHLERVAAHGPRALGLSFARHSDDRQSLLHAATPIGS
ncbi:MAG TPA: hypothetical protein VF545_03000 [Thermoleophilaceae bacterium]